MADQTQESEMKNEFDGCDWALIILVGGFILVIITLVIASTVAGIYGVKI
jgi:hypothetical protein